ncbi:MAG TPA: hypothetical protein VK195_00125 [Burkholderiaceae bacterium]|nr:hypothetical protein [Burkholderiaceae bacterium]
MPWNYRVMNRDGELAIYEVYYDDEGRVRGHGSEPTFPAGDSIEALRANCALFLTALEKGVLVYAQGSA